LIILQLEIIIILVLQYGNRLRNKCWPSNSGPSGPVLEKEGSASFLFSYHPQLAVVAMRSKNLPGPCQKPKEPLFEFSSASSTSVGSGYRSPVTKRGITESHTTYDPLHCPASPPVPTSALSSPKNRDCGRQMARVWQMILCEYIVITNLCSAVVSAQRTQSIHESEATSTAPSADRARTDSLHQSSTITVGGASLEYSLLPNLQSSMDRRAAPLSTVDPSSDPEEDVLRARAGFTSTEDDDGMRPSDRTDESDYDYNTIELDFGGRRMSPAEASEAFLGTATSRVERGLFYSCFKKYYSYSCSCGKGMKNSLISLIIERIVFALNLTSLYTCSRLRLYDELLLLQGLLLLLCRTVLIP